MTSSYSAIFFGADIEIDDPELWAKSAVTEINQKWWAYMATNPDNSPVSKDLNLVFHLD